VWSGTIIWTIGGGLLKFIRGIYLCKQLHSASTLNLHRKAWPTDLCSLSVAETDKRREKLQTACFGQNWDILHKVRQNQDILPMRLINFCLYFFKSRRLSGVPAYSHQQSTVSLHYLPRCLHWTVTGDKTASIVTLSEHWRFVAMLLLHNKDQQ